MMQSRRGFLGSVVAAIGAISTVALGGNYEPPFPELKDSRVEPTSPTVPAMESFVPELWAKESLRVLQDSMVMSNLVRRDFTDLPVCRDRVKCR